ncbi:MAG: ABC transporter ATP-binding protein [Pseudomonadales bacterium]|nr:ABC transporter ATP-binding protein [Pseudomonadales bacterium]
MEIRLDSISKIYDESAEETPALSDIDLRIESSEFFFLLGPSGCGKTTLLRLIAGLLSPTGGKIFFDDRDVTELPVDQRDAAMVFQGYALWPHMTVRDNVEFGPRMRGSRREERQRVAMDQLQRVQMDRYADRKPNQLSGGQQQRVAVARALAAGTRCLLMDEPLSNLDARLRLHMRDELRTLVKTSGMTAVYVTHDQKEALSMADRIAVLNEGQVVQVGTPEELYNRPASYFVADFLGEANFLAGRIADDNTIDTACGRIGYDHDGGMKPGEEAMACIRPERIAIETGPARSEESGNGDNLVPATVLSTVYLGEIRQFTCTLGESKDTVWRVSMLAHQAPEVTEGDKVSLRFATHHCALVPMPD